MAAFHISHVEELAWVSAVETVDDETARNLTEGDRASHVRTHHPGSETDLQMFEIRVPPNGRTSQHAHEEDEIMYVAAGSVSFGKTVLGVGSSAYVPAFTLYAFTAGGDGAVVVNFRARRDSTFITREEMTALRNGR
jgi:quercetin dioxygenase-like cupin family protein